MFENYGEIERGKKIEQSTKSSDNKNKKNTEKRVKRNFVGIYRKIFVYFSYVIRMFFCFKYLNAFNITQKFYQHDKEIKPNIK